MTITEILTKYLSEHDVDDSDIYSQCLVMAATLAHKFGLNPTEFSDDAHLTIESIRYELKK